MLQFFLVFLILFAPVVQSPLGIFADLSLLVTMLLVFIAFFGRVQIDRSLYYLSFLLVLIAIVASTNMLLLTEQIDFNSLLSILRPIKGIMNFIAVYVIVKFSFNHRKTENAGEIYGYILTLVYISIVVHAIIIILQFIFPSFLAFTYSWLIDMDVLEYNKKFRMPGLTAAGGAQTSAVQGLGFLMGIHLLLINKNKYLIFLGNSILILSIIMTGRTGFILVFISLFYWLISMLTVAKKKQRIKYVLMFIMGIIVIQTGSFILTQILNDDVYFNIAMNRTFESYDTYKKTGNVSDSTIEALMAMIEPPDTVGVMLIGNGSLYDNTLGKYSSDIGYIRLWWGYGIVGLLGFISVYLLIGSYIRKNWVLTLMGSQNVLFGLIMIFSIFVLNFKEVFFLARITNLILLFSTLGLYWLACMDKKFHLNNHVEFKASSI